MHHLMSLESNKIETNNPFVCLA